MTLPVRSLLLAGLLLTVAPLACQADDDAATLKTLHSYWSAGRGDSLTMTREGADSDRTLVGYRLIRKEGTLFGRALPTTRELAQYRHPDTGRHVLAADPASRLRAEREGYELVRIEGYVLSQKEAGTRALELFWHPRDRDYLTTASDAGARSARATGYQLVRIEGWLPGARKTARHDAGPPAAWRKELAAAVAEDHEPLSLFWSAATSDYLTTTKGNRAKGHASLGTVALVRKEAASGGTVPLELYWHEGREDHLLVASPDGIQGAELLGYERIGTVGHAFAQPGVGTVPLQLFWSASHGDYASVPAGCEAADLSGYHLVRTEAHVFPPAARD